MKICSIDGCDLKHYAGDKCRKHHRRWRYENDEEYRKTSLRQSKERRMRRISENPELYRQNKNETTSRERKKLKREVMDYYGKVCLCCGEDAIEFLSIDHIAGGGNVQRKSIGRQAGQDFYRWLRKEGYPLGYQVLCHNCNQSLGAFGYCPHEYRKGVMKIC